MSFDIRVAEVGIGQVGAFEVDKAVGITADVHIQVTQVGVAEVGVFERDDVCILSPLVVIVVNRLELQA